MYSFPLMLIPFVPCGWHLHLREEKTPMCDDKNYGHDQETKYELFPSQSYDSSNKSRTNSALLAFHLTIIVLQIKNTPQSSMPPWPLISSLCWCSTIAHHQITLFSCQAVTWAKIQHRSMWEWDLVLTGVTTVCGRVGAYICVCRCVGMCVRSHIWKYVQRIISNSWSLSENRKERV